MVSSESVSVLFAAKYAAVSVLLPEILGEVWSEQWLSAVALEAAVTAVHASAFLLMS